MKRWGVSFVWVCGAVAAFSGCGATPDASEIVDNEPRTEEEVASSAAAASSCAEEYQTTLAVHVAQGRATQGTFLFWPAFYATGPKRELLGLDGKQVVMLYLARGGGYTPTVADCLLPYERCGDGIRQAGELCDGNDLGGATCASVVPGTTGTLTCLSCQNFSATACHGQCGNGIVENGEQCDGDVSDYDCGSRPNTFPGYNVKCTDCSLDYTGCRRPTCGDGVRELLEVCDGADTREKRCSEVGALSTRFPDAPVTCKADCTGLDTSQCHFACGDGVLDEGEQCDGGVGSSTCASVDFAPAFPFFNMVKYASGTLRCSGCRFDATQCKPWPGCYWLPSRVGLSPTCL